MSESALASTIRRRLPFRAARTPEAAVDELRRCAGTQFDAAVVEAFVALLPEVRRTSVAAA